MQRFFCFRERLHDRGEDGLEGQFGIHEIEGYVPSNKPWNLIQSHLCRACFELPFRMVLRVSGLC